jgi:uncharacterized protein (TIGR03435 family)
MRLASLVVATALVAAPHLHAQQDLSGTWQGVLTATPDIRTLIKIDKPTNGVSTGTLYRVDQADWMPTPVAAITAKGKAVTFTIPNMDVTFAGKLSDDGATISGTWAHGAATHALSLTHVKEDAAWTIPPPPPRPKPMPATADPSFDVVTIKPAEPAMRGKGIGFRGRHFIGENLTVNDLLGFAYGVHTDQIIGAPPWFATDHFVIDGVPDTEGIPSQKQQNSMLAKMLVDRFALKFHHEQKELPVYVITVAHGGPKMTKSTMGPDDGLAFFFRSFGDLTVRNLDMKDFAGWFQGSVTDKPVVDHTGLTDRYDFNLKWTPDDSQFIQFRGSEALPPIRDEANAPPSLYTAFQEQLGLKLEATHAMDDVIVIDHVDKPSPN